MRIRTLAAVFGAIVVLIIAAGVVVLLAIDVGTYKDDIAAAVSNSLGRDVTIDGDLELKVSLSPTIRLAGVRVANAPWGSRPDMVRIDSLSAQVELFPLLFRDIRIRRFSAVGADILLETDANGNGNWIFDRDEPDGSSAAPDAATGDGNAGADADADDGAVLEGGRHVTNGPCQAVRAE